MRLFWLSQCSCRDINKKRNEKIEVNHLIKYYSDAQNKKVENAGEKLEQFKIDIMDIIIHTSGIKRTMTQSLK